MHFECDKEQYHEWPGGVTTASQKYLAFPGSKSNLRINAFDDGIILWLGPAV